MPRIVVKLLKILQERSSVNGQGSARVARSLGTMVLSRNVIHLHSQVKVDGLSSRYKYSGPNLKLYQSLLGFETVRNKFTARNEGTLLTPSFKIRISEKDFFPLL